MATLQEMIANTQVPDDFVFSTADGQQVKLGDFRGHVSAGEKRVQNELKKLEEEWTKIKKAQEDISALYTHMTANPAQPANGNESTDELARYLADENWNPVVKRLMNLERNLNGALQRIGQQYQQLQSFLWQTRYEAEYFTHKPDLGELSFQDAIKEMQAGNHFRELAPNIRVPSLVPLAEKRRTEAAQKKEREELEAKLVKVKPDNVERLPKPTSNMGVKQIQQLNAMPDNTSLRRNPFAGIREQVAGDNEIAALANP